MARKSVVPSTKLFVIDTNVVLHDPSSLFRFQEHDLYIPFITLEELDKHKVGTQDINRNARTTIRTLASLMNADGLASAGLSKGFNLTGASDGLATGKLFFQNAPLEFIEGTEHKADNQFLAVVKALQSEFPGRYVAIVSKDINLRVKAIALGFNAEDYLNDHTLEDTDLLPSGVLDVELPQEEVDATFEWTSRTEGYLPALAGSGLVANEFLVFPNKEVMQVVEAGEGDNPPLLRRVPDRSAKRNSVWGLHARNAEQSMALQLLLDPNVDLVTLLGPAGTGKTLLTMAAALEQILEMNLFHEAIYTRATVPLGDDIGFLPGSEEEKMQPWLGALEDALDLLLEGKEQDHKRPVSKTSIQERIKTKSIAFMRGRTFNQKLVILDEAQNLTPKQVKALITRIGPGSKLVLMGNLAQIDSPYLTEASSGLAYAVERFRGWAHFGHLILSQGERSRLATFANDNL